MTLQHGEPAAKLRQVAQVCQVAGWLLSPAVSMKQVSLLAAGVQALPLHVDLAHSWPDTICLKPWMSNR